MDEEFLAGGHEWNPAVNDVDTVFSRIPNDSTIYKFLRDTIARPGGGHLQGMQAKVNSNRSFYILSGSSNESAYLLTVDKASLKAIGIKDITLVPTPNNDYPSWFSRLKHAGGFQVIGNYLVVGLENIKEEGSIISLYEIEMDDSSLKLVFKRNLAEREGIADGTATAGAVGIVKLESGEFLMPKKRY